MIGHLEGEREDGDLDHARAVERFVGANAGGVAGRQMLDPDARSTGKSRQLGELVWGCSYECQLALLGQYEKHVLIA